MSGWVVCRFESVRMTADVSTEEEVRINFDHEGSQLWFECPRSGAYIWDDATKVLAIELGVYTILGMTL